MPVPGPAALGRGVVITSGQTPPEAWAAAPVVTVDAAALAKPQAVVTRLHHSWSRREPVVVELAVDPGVFRAPQAITAEVWTLGPATEPWFDRLHFLVWANTYDARSGDPIWWWARKAARIGGQETPAGPGDLALPDGTAVWIDGGPRAPLEPADLDGSRLIHSQSIELGKLALAPLSPVDGSAHERGAGISALAPDQLGAVLHQSGPARVIAPAGSGKTRVLTERLRHLIVDRGWETASVLAVAYNKEAQLELERRTADFQPRVKTLNALGLWVLTQHRGQMPGVLGEREVRSLVESLLPGRRQRRANTDPIGPYLDGLGLIRLGLADPSAVEASRDDVDGLSELFEPYRRQLAKRGVIDFDEQIYGALEALLRDGDFRRAMQAKCRHLLIDEFQDLTPAHVLLIRLLALPALDVFGVGDDDQVIYGHNAADPKFLIGYEQLFPAAGDHPLTVNYRCPVPVIDAARHLLGYNNRRVQKTIAAGPSTDPSPQGLTLVNHGPDDAAQSLVKVVRGWLDDQGVEPQAVAVLARVNSLLLAPQVALASAGIALNSVLGPEVLERTGMRAALAYLRLAVAGDQLATRDIVEILKRPTRGLPQWFPDRLERRITWSPRQIRSLADQVPDKEAAKVLRLAEDLAEVVKAARGGTTRNILEVVRDEVGLGSAMGLLDRTGSGQGSSHLDDLEGLLGVADLHPDPVGFESWLRSLFNREIDGAGVTLSTIHRVKGREWDRVVVFGVMAGVVPHRLSEDIEEERRVLHVGITRGREQVALLADQTRRSPFLGELDGSAPKRRAAAPVAAEGGARRTNSLVTPMFKTGGKAKSGSSSVAAALGQEMVVNGGYETTVIGADHHGVQVRVAGGGTLKVRYGERVQINGKKVELGAPEELWGTAAQAEVLLRAWRSKESRSIAKPAYTILSDAHLRGIALAMPTTAEELMACDGIGPAKLERWGDVILATLDQVESL